jgi:hypothetical protein
MKLRAAVAFGCMVLACTGCGDVRPVRLGAVEQPETPAAASGQGSQPMAGASPADPTAVGRAPSATPPVIASDDNDAGSPDSEVQSQPTTTDAGTVHDASTADAASDTDDKDDESDERDNRPPLPDAAVGRD